jgi:hypothetical protein
MMADYCIGTVKEFKPAVIDSSSVPDYNVLQSNGFIYGVIFGIALCLYFYDFNWLTKIAFYWGLLFLAHSLAGLKERKLEKRTLVLRKLQ